MYLELQLELTQILNLDQVLFMRYLTSKPFLISLLCHIKILMPIMTPFAMTSFYVWAAAGKSKI